MSQARYLISRISSFVNDTEQEVSADEHDLAQQFAELCRSFNDRVDKCNELLDKGMRSEAVQEALSQPSLLELEELFDNTPELKKWRNLCRDLGMEVPQEIDVEGMDRIKGECSKEANLEPLLKKFRRLANEGKIEERIQLLRQIRRLDPQNQVWQENLEPLEREQLKGIRERVQKAIDDNDYEELENLYEDLSNPQRVLSPDKAILSKIEEKLREQRVNEAFAEGKELSGKLKEARDNNQVEECRQLLNKWRRLSKFPDFEPSEEMNKTVDAVRQWCDKEEEKIQQDKAFEAVLENVKNLMQEKNPDVDELETAWHSLNSFGKEIPSSYKERVPALISDLKHRRKNQRRKKVLSKVAVVLILIGAGSFAGLKLWQQQQIDKNYQTLKALLKDGKLEQAQKRIQALEKNRPKIYETGKISLVRRQMQQKMEQKEKFENVMAELKKIRKNDYTASDNRIEELIDEGLELALNTANTRQVKAWNEQWQSWKQSRKKEKQEKIAGMIDQLTEILDDYYDEGVEELRKAEERFSEAEELYSKLQEETLQASERQAEKITAQGDKIAAWEKRLNKRKSEQEKVQRERREFAENLSNYVSDLGKYKKKLQDFINRFPDAPESEAAQKTLDNMSVFRDALALTGRSDIAGFPMTDEEDDRITEILNALPAGEKSIWAPDLSKLAKYPEQTEKARSIIKELRTSDFWDLKSIRYKKPGSSEWKTRYYRGDFYSRKQESEEGDEVTLYWGQGLVQNSYSYKPIQEHVSYSTEQYDIEASMRDVENLVPSAKFARRVLEAMPAGQPPEDYFLERMEELLNDDEMRAVPKAIIIRKLTRAAVEASVIKTPYLAQVKEQISDGLNYEVPWINQANVRVRKEVKNIKEQLDKINISDIKTAAKSIEFNRWLLLAVLNRDVQIAGVVEKRLDNNELYPDLLRDDIQSAWTVVPGAENLPNKNYKAVQFKENEQFSFTQEGSGRAFQGQVLFGWADHKSVNEFLDQGPYPVKEVNIDWPYAWPYAGK